MALTLSALPLLLAGCTVGPNYEPPATEMPQTWVGAMEGGLVAEPVDLGVWWTSFKDPTLDGLVERALEANLDLREARARVLEARAQRGVVAADDQIQLNANSSYTRSRASENGVPGGNFGSAGRETDLFQLGFDASWELDVFGGVRRGVEAADGDIGAAEEDLGGVRVSLLAEVARNYVELRGFQERLRIAMNNVGVQAETVTLSRARYEAGLSSELDLKRAEAQLATTQSSIPTFQAGARASTFRLALLLGARPDALVDELSTPKDIPVAVDRAAVGVPADLLRRRPDIRGAERRLAAATARVGVATADLYPKFTIVGSLGLQASQIGDFVDANSRFYNIGPGVRWAILSGGRIRSNIKVQEARVEQAAARYERAVLTALQESEEALVNYVREQERLRSLQEAVVAQRRAVELASELNARGLTDFFSVLDTQRQLFALEDQSVQSRQAVSANLISVYKALAGGWGDPVGPTSAQPAGTPPTVPPPPN
ncbi:MAG: efflux transporter outer membrane subunit [Phycisphaerales bacterium]